MVRQSNYRSALVEAVSRLIPEAQDATDALDEAAAGRLQINRTDLRCLGVVIRSGTISAGALAKDVSLTRGAMTTALDRLQRAGYVQRTGDPNDGRGVRVEATAAAAVAIRQIWGPLANEGLKRLGQYSDAELQLIQQFLVEYCTLQRVHAERIRDLDRGVQTRRRSRAGDRTDRRRSSIRR
jgi:DNA-binding MarR family transcriptional regulator